MKIHRTLIIRSFRGMSAASSRSPALCNSLHQNQPPSPLVNPQIARFCFGPIIPNISTFSSATATRDSVRRWPKEARTVSSAAGKHVVEGNDEYSEHDSLMENALHPRPQEVPWQKELANRVHLIGVIAQPVHFTRTKLGKALAWTTLEVRMSKSEKIMRFPVKFFFELAETAAEHLKQNDRVCIVGRFSVKWGTDGEDDKRNEYEVLANTLNFVSTSSYFSQQVVDKNTPSPARSGQADIDRDTRLQYQKSTVMSSSSGKNAQESANLEERLWQTFFANPLEWWDNRAYKRSPKYPDFKHKDTGEALWIESKYSPRWLKSQLRVLDSKLKGEGASSRGSRGSLSSFHVTNY